MAPSRRARSAFAIVAVAAALLGVALLGGTAAASHGPEAANFTVEPMDRTPGATDVKYGQIVVAEGGTDLETLEGTKAVYDEGSWAQCSSSDSETFGIDRGNTHEGYEIDEELAPYTKTFSAGEDVFEIEYNGEDDFGSSTYFDDGDAFVAVAECLQNPDEPGWYQISGSTTGVTENGERVTVGDESHYFWIGDFEDEQEAREELGPPPSEPQETATPTPEPATESESGGEGDGGSSDERSSTEESASTPTPTATPTPTPVAATEAPAAAATETPTPTAADWDGAVVQTPTPGDGPGFGPVVALVSLLVAAILFRRR